MLLVVLGSRGFISMLLLVIFWLKIFLGNFGVVVFQSTGRSIACCDNSDGDVMIVVIVVVEYEGLNIILIVIVVMI